MTSETTALVRALNDNLRQTLRGGRVVVTRGVMEREPCFLTAALTAIRAFETFDKDNDPWDEHDFGAFEIGEARLFWKIAYYDESLKAGAENPADEARCVRVPHRDAGRRILTRPALISSTHRSHLIWR